MNTCPPLRPLMPAPSQWLEDTLQAHTRCPRHMPHPVTTSVWPTNTKRVPAESSSSSFSSPLQCIGDSLESTPLGPTHIGFCVYTCMRTKSVHVTHTDFTLCEQARGDVTGHSFQNDSSQTFLALYSNSVNRQGTLLSFSRWFGLYLSSSTVPITQSCLKCSPAGSCAG